MYIGFAKLLSTDGTMRTHHCTIADIRRRADLELAQLLPWRTAHGLSAEAVVRILWLLATLKASLHALARRFRFPVGDTSLRAAIARQLPGPEDLAAAFARRLHALLPRVPKKGFVVAIDTHWVGYYGDKAKTRGVVGGQYKNGTRRFFVYATAVIVERGRRYTLAFAAPTSNRPLDALGPLLDQIAESGVRVRMLLLDKAFYAAEVFGRLEDRRLPFVVAVPHRRAALRDLWAGGGSRATRTLTTGHRTGRDRVSVRVRLTRVHVRNRDGSADDHVYAYRGLRPRGDLGAACQRVYRSRFGIESSYRQLNQAKARTTSRNRSWRVLLVGLALLFRQVWVLVSGAVRRPKGSVWSAVAALERLRNQLAAALVAGLEEQATFNLKPKGIQALTNMPNT